MITKPDIRAVLEAHGATRVPVTNGWASMRCPYHKDRDASASVNATLSKFRCHGCGVHGDALDLIQHHEGVDFKQAVTIADSFGTRTVITPTRRTYGRNR